jgi:hypothetical protein
VLHQDTWQARRSRNGTLFVVRARLQNLLSLEKDFLRWNILTPFIRQWHGASQLAVDTIPIAGFERDGVNAQ